MSSGVCLAWAHGFSPLDVGGCPVPFWHRRLPLHGRCGFRSHCHTAPPILTASWAADACLCHCRVMPGAAAPDVWRHHARHPERQSCPSPTCIRCMWAEAAARTNGSGGIYTPRSLIPYTYRDWRFAPPLHHTKTQPQFYALMLDTQISCHRLSAGYHSTPGYTGMSVFSCQGPLSMQPRLFSTIERCERRASSYDWWHSHFPFHTGYDSSPHNIDCTHMQTFPFHYLPPSLSVTGSWSLYLCLYTYTILLAISLAQQWHPCPPDD